MFQQIINEMAVLKNWSKSEKGWIFNCDHYKEEDLQPVLSFFKLHNLEPLVFDFETTKQIELSEQDFETLHQAFYLFKTKKNLFIGPYTLTDPLSSEDIEYFKKHIIFKTDKSFSKEDELDEKNQFFDFIFQNTAHSVFSRCLFNEFITEMRKRENHQPPLSPINIVIEFGRNATEKLKEENAKGLYTFKNGHPTILLSDINEIDQKDFISIFVHEFKHVMQHLNPSVRSADKAENGIIKTVDTLVREAEAKAYELTIYSSQHPFCKTLISQEMDNQAKLLIKNNEREVPYAPNLTQAQKIAADLRFIQVETTDKIIQVLAQSFLASSRLNIYKTLKDHDIQLPSREFSDLARFIEKWRDYYFPRTVFYQISDKKAKLDGFPTIKKLEETWEKCTGLQLKLSPTHIFSEPIARSLGIHFLIYGHSQTKTTPREQIYQGVTDTLPDVSMLYEEKRFDEIYQIYNHIQQQNLYLPKINQTTINKESAYSYMRAIQKMKNNEPLKEVISTLGYFLVDCYLGNRWTPPVKKEELQRS